MEELEWMPVNGYEGLYEINKLGIVRSLHKRNFKKIMPQRIDRGGYYTVRLSKNGKDCTVYIHRLISFAFIINEQNKPIINHINGNKLDNSIENLEWSTHSENMKHAFKYGLVSIKSKCVVDRCSGVEYTSIKEASRISLIPYSTLKGMLNGTRRNTSCLEIAA